MNLNCILVSYYILYYYVIKIVFEALVISVIDVNKKPERIASKNSAGRSPMKYKVLFFSMMIVRVIILCIGISKIKTHFICN